MLKCNLLSLNPTPPRALSIGKPFFHSISHKKTIPTRFVDTLNRSTHWFLLFDHSAWGSAHARQRVVSIPCAVGRELSHYPDGDPKLKVFLFGRPKPLSHFHISKSWGKCYPEFFGNTPNSTDNMIELAPSIDYLKKKFPTTKIERILNKYEKKIKFHCSVEPEPWLVCVATRWEKLNNKVRLNNRTPPNSCLIINKKTYQTGSGWGGRGVTKKRKVSNHGVGINIDVSSHVLYIRMRTASPDHPAQNHPQPAIYTYIFWKGKFIRQLGERTSITSFFHRLPYVIVFQPYDVRLFPFFPILLLVVGSLTNNLLEARAGWEEFGFKVVPKSIYDGPPHTQIVGNLCHERRNLWVKGK